MISNKKIIQVNARKFDDRIHRSWKCKFVERRNSLLVFVGEFENEVIHNDLGIIKQGTISHEYYWLDRWYNIFRFHEPDGKLRNFYCNINSPPRFEDGVLDYVDFDIDVLVWQDYRFEILDLDEFHANSIKFNYSDETIENVKNSLAEVLKMVKQRIFPFDFDDRTL